MSERTDWLTDEAIAQFLRTRSADAGPGLLGDIARAAGAMPQERPWFGRPAPRSQVVPRPGSGRLIVLVAATMLLAAALGAAIAVGSGILRLQLFVNQPDLGIFEPVAGQILYIGEGGLWAVDPSSPSPGSTVEAFDPEGVGGASHFASFTVPLGWSKDGTELLFLRDNPIGRFGDRQPPFDHYLYILHANGTETLVTPGPVADAALSPDGSRVAFAPGGVALSSGGEGLYVIDVTGGEPVLIAQDGASPTFSPDGTQVAYLGLPRTGSRVEATPQTGPEQVWVVNLDGTGAHEILVGEPVLAEGIFHITWSPAGDRIAMENSLHGHFAIYTFGPDGSEFTEVLPFAYAPYWSPDGSQIAYSAIGSDGVSLADADGSHVRNLGVGNSGPWHPRAAPASPSASPIVSESVLPSASARHSPAAGYSRFTSPMQGISIDYPSDWQVRPATEAWQLSPALFEAPDVDFIFDPALGERLYIALASGAASVSQLNSSHDTWPSIETVSGVCDGRNWGEQGDWGGGWGRITVDGVIAWGGYCNGSDPNGAINHYAFVETATRGYVIYLHVGEPRLRQTYDGSWLDGLLATVDLLP
jgi:hypothetical protein